MLVRWSDWDVPFDPFADLRRQVDRMFDETRPARREPREWPGFELVDEGERLVVRGDLPGVAEKDLELAIEEDVLSLKAKRSVEGPTGYTAHRRERTSFELARSFTLPARVDPEKSAAKFEAGVLTITLPKERSAQPRKIQIQTRS